MDETFDFVVVGSGGGAGCAALMMRSQGKSAAILEKTPYYGGTTALSGGVMWIPNNPLMKKAGVPDSRERALQYLDAVVGDHNDTPGATRARRETYVDEGPRMVDFLASQGIGLHHIPSWPDYHDAPGHSVPGRTITSKLFDANKLGEWKGKLRPGFIPLPALMDELFQLPLFKRSWKAKQVLVRVMTRGLIAKLTGKHLLTAGNALQAQQLHTALKAGVDVRVEAGVKQILVENGKVTGVVVEKNGADWRIGARLGVLINAGGFARNQRMLDTYIPGVKAEWSNTANGDTGEMIEEGMRVGAAIAQMDERIGSQMALIPGNPGPVNPMMQGDICKPHSLMVDQAGHRYMNEAGSYMDVTRRIRDRDKESPAVPSWLVVDSQYTDKYMLVGTLPGSAKPQGWIDSGFLRKGDTIEQLAEACSLDPATLRASVERFNGFVRKGHDDDFNRGDGSYEKWIGDAMSKGAESLGTVEKGPFYAIQIYPGDVSTYGGLVTDTHARVLRPDGQPIEGLYATGVSTASVMGRGSTGAGASVGPSLVWAYVAAKHAAARV